MATYHVTSPEGATYEVNAPEGAADADVMRYAQNQWLQEKRPAQPTPNIAAGNPEVNTPFGTIKTPPNESGFNLPAFIISGGQKADSILRGARRLKLEAGGTVYTALGLDKQAGINAQIQADQAMRDQENDKNFADLQSIHPGSTQLGGTAPLLPLGATGLVAAAGLEDGDMTDRAKRVGLTLAGNKLMQAGGNIAARQYATSTAKAAENAAANAADVPFRDAGLVVPPAQANPTAINRLLEGISGGAKTDQAASRINAPAINNLAKDALGIPRDQKLSTKGLEQFRADQYATGYKPLADIPSIPNDPQFIAGVSALSPASAGGAVKNPAQIQIDDLIASLSKQQNWTGQQWLSDVRLLRESANANFAAARRSGGDIEKTTLARAQMGAANKLEDLASRNGNEAAVQAMQQARQKIAMSHEVSNALNDTTGNVAARDVEGLNGPLKTIQQFAEKYPKSAQTIDSAAKANPLSVVDTMMTSAPALYAGLAHGPLLGAGVMAAGTVGRPLLRAGLMSRAYQNNMLTRPEQPRGLLASKALNNEWAPWLGGLVGYEGANR